MNYFMLIFLLSRVLFGGFFILNGFNHIFKGKNMIGYASSKKVPMPKIAILVSGIMMLLGGAGILAGVFVPIAVSLIALFLIVVTFKMHDFWNQTDPNMRMMDYIQFTKNVALLGGALAFLFV